MGRKKTFYSFRRRAVYIGALLGIIVPIVVGVLVWYFTSNSCSEAEGPVAGITDASKGNLVSTRAPRKDVTTAATNGSSTENPSNTEPWKNPRLPKATRPIHYDITLYPNFYEDNGWFYGNESVELEIGNETSFILIHINYLNVTRTVLRNKMSGEEILIKDPFFYEENQFWVIETIQPLPSGRNVILDLEFDGSLTRSIVGFYKSKYVNSITGETRYLASSKFEPVSARRAFPCFDEPNFKAEYTVHLIHKDGYIALSNMPEQVRTYATPDRVNQTSFAMQIAVHSMELYQEVFNVSYPLPKQDLIGIPDFVSGAMEHWGLITYRETNMLYDPREASTANQQRVAVVVAHEVSHQWFGNIVTMDWWDDLWLNEGFASYMQYFGSDSAEPTWEMLEQFVTDEVQPVMVTDSAVSSHPIIINVNNPNQINEVFDSISYNKGAAVIKMLEAIMGEENFFKGVGNYLKTYKWGNAKTDDLWYKLNEVNQANFQVKQMMDTWTRQMGYPFINVSFHNENGNTKATATQKRFLADKTIVYNEMDSAYRYKWFVNVRYQSNNGAVGDFWINQTENTVTIDVPVNPSSDPTSWIKFNINQTGYYRVNYPSEIWAKFASSLQTDPNTISVVDKAGLIDDVFNLARAGYIEYENALNMTLYLDKETSYLPWQSIFKSFGYISDMFQTVGTFGVWRRYVLSKCKPIMESVGWDDDGSHLKKLLRTNLISLTCVMGDQDCLKNASTLFRRWLDDGQSIPPNTRSLVYRFGMQNGGTPEDWEKMWQKYKTETVPQEQIKLLYGLSQTKQMWLLVSYVPMSAILEVNEEHFMHKATKLLMEFGYLEYARDETKVRSQDFFTVLTYIAENPIGKPVVWNWVQSNWDYLVKRFTLFSRTFGRLVPGIVSDFNSEFYLRQVEDFFAKYPDAGAGARGREQALESIKRNIRWMKLNEGAIKNWLCNYVQGC